MVFLWKKDLSYYTMYIKILTRIVAFSVDILSDGKPSLFHPATTASSVSIVIKSSSSVIGIGTCGQSIHTCFFSN